MGIFVLEFFVYFEKKNLSETCVCKYFTPSLYLSFDFLNKVFHRVEIFNLIKSTIFLFSFVDCLFMFVCGNSKVRFDTTKPEVILIFFYVSFYTLYNFACKICQNFSVNLM